MQHPVLFLFLVSMQRAKLTIFNILIIIMTLYYYQRKSKSIWQQMNTTLLMTFISSLCIHIPLNHTIIILEPLYIHVLTIIILE